MIRQKEGKISSKVVSYDQEYSLLELDGARLDCSFFSASQHVPKQFLGIFGHNIKLIYQTTITHTQVHAPCPLHNTKSITSQAHIILSSCSCGLTISWHKRQPMTLLYYLGPYLTRSALSEVLSCRVSKLICQVLFGIKGGF